MNIRQFKFKTNQECYHRLYFAEKSIRTFPIEMKVF